jgi:alcohol dehydrogenase class IV
MMYLAKHYNTADRKSFRTATRLYAGKNARLDLGQILSAAPVLLVTDTRFADSDAAKGLQVVGRVEVNSEPRLDQFETEVAKLPASRPQAVVAIGGGSAIDMAKALHAFLSFGRHDVRDQERPAGAPGLIAVPTTAGSGSETSRFFILSDRSGTKLSHRAWSFAPDVAILDPIFLQQAGAERVLLGMFDAFVHLWETYICRNEQSSFVDMLCLESFPHIAMAVRVLAEGGDLSEQMLSALQRSSAYGGMAIANVRTGFIHTLGESLAAHVSISHPESLYVFFDTVLDHYAPALAEKIDRVNRRFAAEIPGGYTVARMRQDWGRAFERHGVTARIKRALSSTRPDIDGLLETVARDKVLPRENPVFLEASDIRHIAASAFESFAPRAVRNLVP